MIGMELKRLLEEISSVFMVIDGKYLSNIFYLFNFFVFAIFSHNFIFSNF